MKAEEKKLVYSLEDVASMIGLSTRTIQRYIDRGLITARTVDGGRRLLFTPEDVNLFIANLKKKGEEENEN